MFNNYSHPIQILSFLFLIISLTKLWGQQDAHLALYPYHMQVLNPAFTGSQGGTFINSTFRSQWIGIDDAPRIQAISLGIPSTEKRLNYGALFYNDKTFIEQQTRFFANFSYRIPLNDVYDVYLGLSAGGENFAVNFDSLQNVDLTGDQYLTTFSRFNPNLGVGVYLKSEKFYAALSTPKLFQTKRFNNDSGFATTARDLVHLFGFVGGKIPLSTDWFWVNTALFRYVARAPWSVVTNTGLAYKNNELTFGYQWDASFAGTLLIQANDFLSFGYSYQFQSSNTLASLSNGNHELLIKIRIGKNAAEETQEEPSSEPEAAIETSANN